VVSGGAWASAVAAAGRDRLNETGGILLGWRIVGGLYVAHVVEVPDAQVHHASYRRRHREAQKALQQVLAELPSDTPVGYVGEWHTHPAPVGPSCSDRRELKRFSRSAGGPIGMIVWAFDPHSDGWSPHGVCASEGRQARAQVEIEEDAGDG
jgi:hypothetical protein